MQYLETDRNQTSRCRLCRLHMGLCICSIRPQLDIKTKIVVAMQWGEFKTKSNTAFMIPQILKNSEIRFRGHENKVPLNLEGTIPEDYQAYLLYPHRSAVELNDSFMESQKKPITLVVPDGNWTQASRMCQRDSLLSQLPTVKLSLNKPSVYQLRARQREGCMCTYEAIARSLGVIEGPGVQEEMELYFNEFIKRSLYIRGKISKSEL